MAITAHAKNLLQEKKLDLQGCIDCCKANEKTAPQLKNIEDVQFMNCRPIKGKYQKGKGQRNQSTSRSKVKYDNIQPQSTMLILWTQSCTKEGKMSSLWNYFAKYDLGK